MTPDIALVFAILAISLVLFISEKVRMDVVALMVLGTLALSGLVSPEDAFAGFSNAAVITVWAMFILSEGLTRTGIADIIGRQVMGLAGRRELPMIVVIMLTAGILSAFMNNIGVAALMLPVVVEISRRTRVAASRLLMPLAYSTLLGGLMTLIGTPPNLLVASALTENGRESFALFDFMPVGAAVMIAGTLFMAFAGRYLLPKTRGRRSQRVRSQRQLRARYRLQESTFMIRIPQDSVLAGRTLADSRITTAANLVVLALDRFGRTETLPNRQTVLRAGDRMLVQGRVERFRDLRRWSELDIVRESPVLKTMLADQLVRAELTLAEDSPLLGGLIADIGFRQNFRVDVLAVRRKDQIRRSTLSLMPLRVGDTLLLQGRSADINALDARDDVSRLERLSAADAESVYGSDERMFIVRVPKDSSLEGTTIGRSRLIDGFDFHLLATFRDGKLDILPPDSETLHGGDLLLMQGEAADMDVLRGLQALEIESRVSPNLKGFQSERLIMQDATLDPRSALAGRTVAELNFRERYGLEVAGLWREGKPLGDDLGDVRLEIGDALLLVGPRDRLQLLQDDPDFLILTPLASTPTDTRKAPLAGLIMLGVVVTVLLGLFPIQVAAVVGATLMVLTKCLSMEQAYRAIEWRAIFLIAGMLPLGVAMEQTGAAELLASQVMATLGGYGPWYVIIGLYSVTAIATMIVPTAALVVLMSPIVLSSMAELGYHPETAMMAIAMAASASFTSPISHPANVLVMGPGGYRFVDYIKIGVPLTLVVFATVMLVLPFFWPLVPLS